MSILNFDFGAQRERPRYITDENGTPVRPHRVFDTHKRETIIYTADPLIASRMAEEYEKQWRRSQWSRRTRQRVVRWFRSLFTRKPTPEPPAPPTEREQRVAFVEDLCARGRQKLASR